MFDPVNWSIYAGESNSDLVSENDPTLFRLLVLVLSLKGKEFSANDLINSITPDFVTMMGDKAFDELIERTRVILSKWSPGSKLIETKKYAKWFLTKNLSKFLSSQGFQINIGLQFWDRPQIVSSSIDAIRMPKFEYEVLKFLANAGAVPSSTLLEFLTSLGKNSKNSQHMNLNIDNIIEKLNADYLPQLIPDVKVISSSDIDPTITFREKKDHNNYPSVYLLSDSSLKGRNFDYIYDTGYFTIKVNSVNRLSRALDLNSDKAIVVIDHYLGKEVVNLLSKIQDFNSSSHPILVNYRDSENLVRNDPEKQSAKIELIEMGVDRAVSQDYRAETVAQLKSLGRNSKPFFSDFVQSGPFTLLLKDQKIEYQGDRLSLSPIEYQILSYLIQYPRVVHSFEDLILNAWGEDSEASKRSLLVHMRWLREKIEKDPSNPQYIKTKRTKGYYLDI